MPLESKVQAQFTKLLVVVDEAGAKGTRLVEDAERLRARVGQFVAMRLLPDDVEIDLEALDLACFAVQLPMRLGRATTVRRSGQLTQRERCEQAAELLIGTLGESVPEELLERTSRILRETPLRSPTLEEAKLLADAMNLDDFGVTGAALLAMQFGRQNLGVRPFVEGFAKREQYGYWEARLKDGFHFEPVRELARRRVEAARKLAEALGRELKEDGAGGEA